MSHFVIYSKRFVLNYDKFSINVDFLDTYCIFTISAIISRKNIPENANFDDDNNETSATL